MDKPYISHEESMKRITLSKPIFSLLLLFMAFAGKAAVVDTVRIYSKVMKKEIPCVVIRPDSYSASHRNGFRVSSKIYPVVYLLHGYGGDFGNWIKKVPSLIKEVDDLQMIIVCPDGAFSSWYFDSPVDSSMKYETFVADEVPAYIDTHYHTIKNKHGRAIAGLSMGGHGALFISIRHPKFFGACGSMSGVVDLFASHDKFDIIKRIGDTSNNNSYWHDYSAINVVEKYELKDSISFIIDCGIKDFTLIPNRKLHEKMLQLNISHDYIERPGDHNWDYWSNSIQYQLLFFRRYFDRYYK